MSADRDHEPNHALTMFLSVYGTLPRAGPGGDEHTVRALGLVPGPRARTVLDLGCGPGAQTIALATALPGARIVAVDMLTPMVDETRRRTETAEVGDRVTAVVGDMASPAVSANSQDLIWCEGAIYHLGVTPALMAWRDLLVPGGSVAFTEAVWLRDDPPAEIVEWWTSAYADISDGAGTRARIEAAGCRTVGSFVLPASAWWDEYYEPMQQRIIELRARFPDDPVASGVAAEAETEIAMFERYHDWYSYEFFVVQPVV